MSNYISMQKRLTHNLALAQSSRIKASALLSPPSVQRIVVNADDTAQKLISSARSKADERLLKKSRVLGLHCRESYHGMTVEVF